jgi:hypothetical protein
MKTYEDESFFSLAWQPLVGQGLLIIEASRSHSDTPHSVALLWTSDQPDRLRDTPIWQHSNETDFHAPPPPGGFEPTIPASKRPQTHALGPAITGIGEVEVQLHEFLSLTPDGCG